MVHRTKIINERKKYQYESHSSFARMSLKISAPNEYLVFTGLGIPEMKILKKGWKMPWEKCVRIDLTPKNYTVKQQTDKRLIFI